MKRFRDPQWVLVLVFLGIIGGVPVAQTVMEAGQEEGVRVFEVFGDWPTAEHLRSYEKNMEKGSWAARLSRPWLLFANFAWLKEGGDKVVLGDDGWYFYRPGLNHMLSRPEAKSVRQTNDPVRAIVDFRDQLAARGIQLLVMPVPNKESIYPDRLTARAEGMRGAMAPDTRDLLERLRAAEVQVVDLFQEFDEARQPGGSHSETPLYLAQDTHWSPEGVALAARAAARRLAELGWVRPGTVEYQEREAPVRRFGDLVRMMQAPGIERVLEPERVPTRQVIRAGSGQPYQDAAEAEILVLGDSVMRIYQQDEPTAAGFIAHLARELKQPMMSLVNDGGGATLVREELAAQPIFLKNKKVVLWEFVERDLGLGIKGWQRTQLPPAPPK